MKKLILSAAGVIAFSALLMSCAPKRLLPRPQGHPAPPKKFAKVMPQNESIPQAVAFVKG